MFENGFPRHWSTLKKLIWLFGSGAGGLGKVWKTVSGAIASFPDGSGLPMRSLVAQINPVQDLHGQSSPYPAGGMGNKWNEDWEAGTINVSSGLESVTNNSIRSKSYSQCTPDTDYYVFCGAGSSQWFLGICWYDENKQFISGGYRNRMTVTSPSNATYFKITTNTSGDVYGNTYNQDIAINYPATVTIYSPYSNICPISGWTGLSGKRTGANLFDKSTGIQLESNNLRIARNQGYGVPFKLRGGVTYTFSCNSNTPAYAYVMVPYSTTAIASSNAKVTSFTYTPTEDVEVGLNFWWDTGRPSDATDFMIEVGSVAHDYSTYTGEAISVSFGTTVYGGSDEVVSGNGTSTMASVDLSTLSWVWSNGSFETLSLADVIEKPPNNTTVANILCSAFKPATNEQTYGHTVDSSISVATTGRIRVYSSQYSSSTNPTTALAGVQFVYGLLTAQSFTHAPTQISTLYGQNNVWHDANGDTTVTYQANLKGYIDKVLGS